jgi:hypothetical protein
MIYRGEGEGGRVLMMWPRSEGQGPSSTSTAKYFIVEAPKSCFLTATSVYAATAGCVRWHINTVPLCYNNICTFRKYAGAADANENCVYM